MSPTGIKITAKDYYELLPSPPHKTGDIWKNLPTFGLLKQKFCSGVVITPACDLSQNKTDTISYLPIIDLSNVFYYKQFYTQIKSELIKLFEKNKVINIFDSLNTRTVPDNESIDAVREVLKDVTDKHVLDKINLGLDHIVEINRHSIDVDLKKLAKFFGKDEWKRICTGLIKNSKYTDVHFLPADGQDVECSGVPRHSLVLFRYPITMPIDILNIADDTYITDWNSSISSLGLDHGLHSFFELRPLRTSRVKKDFITEILTRYLSLYIRMGSPDFTDATIKTYYGEIGA